MPSNAELVAFQHEIESVWKERPTFSDFGLALIKPKAIQQCLENIIIERIESKGLVIVKRKMLKLGGEQVDALYPNLKNEFFYEDMKAFLMSDCVMALIVGGNGIDVAKELVRIKGHSHERGTIRGDFFNREWVGSKDLALWEKGIHPRQAEITIQVVAQNTMHSLERRELIYQGIAILFNKDELKETSNRIGGFREFLNDCRLQANIEK